MNAPLSPLTPPRRLMAADVMFLVEHGLIDPSAKFELMDGDIIPMPAKGRHHEIMRERVEFWLKQPWAQRFNVLREHTITLDRETLVEPDFLLYDAGRRIADAPLTGSDIRLVVEVAESSWLYDVESKAPKYARFGIAEYWVLHATRRTARVFREPGAGGYGRIDDLTAGAGRLSPLCAPAAVFDLAE